MQPMNPMTKTMVFEGNELSQTVPVNNSPQARCAIRGQDASGKPASFPFSDDLLSKHLLFIGGIGMGKTNGIFQILSQLRNNMTSDDVMVVFDTKGDFYDSFYRQGDIVISNDDKATGPRGRDYWNIFEEINAGINTEEEIVEIARALFFERSNKSSQPFFPNAARDLFSGIMLHFHRMGGVKNNAVLRNFLDQTPSAEIRAILQQHQDLKAMTSYISDDRSPQTQGVISELQQHLREIFIGNFRKEGNLSIRQAIRAKQGRLVFVEYDLGIGGMLTPIYQLMLDMAIKEALSRKKSDGNVWFIIDEFRLIPNLQHIDDGINFGRSMGAKFIIGVQNIEQVFHAYGEAQAHSILSGLLTTVAFRVNDAATRKFIQELVGKNRKKEVFMSSVSSRGIVEQIREANVVEDWDIANMRVGEAIINTPGYGPFFFRFDKVK
ncbi:MAG TPA: type IV secretion system DNA-binding domain-containing protein [Anaerolineaceae bacterium]|nr:type IV secretion system DNA-binding domain-containing protein [Anaerolineaceae bacterium]